VDTEPATDTTRPFLMNARRILMVALCACSMPQAPPAYTVEIFAEDTVTADVTVSVDGPMTVNLRGDAFFMRGKSFVVTTPAWLVVNGVGTATITSVDRSKRLAIVPKGLPADSAEAATVVGAVVKLTRREGESAVRMEAARP
jgi:hypothetical protein